MAHQHNVYDTDLHFRIDPITRTIINQTTGKTKVIQYDHNSERFTFEIPRHVDGHDMSLSDKVEIHFINTSKNGNNSNNGVYVCDDVQLSPDDENVVIFSWLISQLATQYEGTLDFIVRFTCVTDKVIDYIWSTGIFAEIKVSGSFYYGT